MVQLSEKCFYVTLITILVILAILLPIIIIQTGEAPPPYIYLSLENDTNSSEYLDDDMKRHIKGYIDKYYKLEDLSNYLDDFALYRSNLFSSEKLGETDPFGNPVNEIVLKREKSKPMVLIVSGLQANDWDSVLTTIEIMNRFYLDTERTSKLLDDFSFHFLPLMNPDGYNFSMSLPIYANWEHNYEGTTKDKPTGRSILYNFRRNETSTQESTFFKDYINRYRDKIKATFFLYTPKNMNFTEQRFTIPSAYVENNARAEAFIGNLKAAAAESAQELGFSVENDVIKGRVDEWLVKQTQPETVLAVNCQAYYKPTPPEKLRSKIQRLGYSFHFVITRVMAALEPN